MGLAEQLEQMATAKRNPGQSSVILWPDSQPDRNQMGGKAAALAQLSHTCPVPAWFVISPQTDVEAHRVDIEVALARLDSSPSARFAVRSSAVAEDGEVASYAGQLASFLNVPASAVVEKLRAVRHSGAAAHVRQYRLLHRGASHSFGIADEGRMNRPAQFQKCGTHPLHSETAVDPSPPAVLVQRMVAAEVAGVAFGADPVTGARTVCTVTAVAGLGDKLVSGLVNGDTYRTARDGTIRDEILADRVPVLLPSQVREIVALLLHVEATMERPQDIEWAFADGRLYLLQARPITTLSVETAVGQTARSGDALPNDNLTIWDNSNIVESYSGVTSPLTFSFARHVYEHVYRAFCRMMGVSEEKITREERAFQNMLGHINGHVYYNLLNWYRVLALFPGFQTNRRFMEQMMGVKEPLADALLDRVAPQQASRGARIIDGLQLARAGLGLVYSQLTLDRTIRHFYARLDETLTLSTETIQGLDLPRLMAEYERVEQELITRWDAPLINDFLCMIAFGLSRKLLEKAAGDVGLQLHSELLIGQGDIISAEPAKRIREMARLATADDQVVDALLSGDLTSAKAAMTTMPTLANAYEAYLAKFGNRCLQELKLESPTLHDDPTSLLVAIGQMARRIEATDSAQPPASGDAYFSAASQLATFFKRRPIKRWVVGKVVQWAKNRVRDRENLRFERTRVFGYARQIFLAMGERLTEQGQLAAPREIFYLEIDEIRQLIDGALPQTDLHQLLAQRIADAQTFVELPAPPNRFESRDGAIPDFNSAAVSGIGHNHPAAGEQRQGIGCCAGVVRAPVRVIDDPRHAHLVAGEIMVARFTDPGWITLFTNAAGILVERGSLLSHSAIVARELGIPAIVAIDGVMDWLETGDLVEMDGATGNVMRESVMRLP